MCNPRTEVMSSLNKVINSSHCVPGFPTTNHQEDSSVLSVLGPKVSPDIAMNT